MSTMEQFIYHLTTKDIYYCELLLNSVPQNLKKLGI